jgi:hypothetical protein
MLKPSRYYSGRCANSDGESTNGGDAEVAAAAEMAVLHWRKKKIGRKSIGFGFTWVASSRLFITVLHERSTLAVFQYMTGFVVKGKPKVVVGFAPKAQLNQRLRGMQPPSSTIGAHTS